jgi:hypothetical protein
LRKRFVFKALSDSVILQVKTKSPEKWLLVDRETGQVYQGSENGHWDRLDPIIKTDKNKIY